MSVLFAKRILLILVFLMMILISITIFAEKDFTYPDYVVNNNYDDAFESARLLGKGVLVLFTLPTCKDCLDLKNNTLQTAEVVEFLRKYFVVVDVNFETLKKGYFPIKQKKPLTAKAYTYRELFTQYGVKKTPTIAIYDAYLNYMGNITGFFKPADLISNILLTLTVKTIPEKSIFRAVPVLSAQLLADTLPDIAVSNIQDFLKEVASGKVFDRLTPIILWGSEIAQVENLLKINTLLPMSIVTTESSVTGKKAVVISEPEKPVVLTPSIVEVTASEALRLYNEKKNEARFVIMDVRTAEEFDISHIPSAININYLAADFEQQLQKLDKQATYFLYCASGGRSKSALVKMIALGFTNIIHFREGYGYWKGPTE